MTTVDDIPLNFLFGRFVTVGQQHPVSAIEKITSIYIISMTEHETVGSAALTPSFIRHNWFNVYVQLAVYGYLSVTQGGKVRRGKEPNPLL